MAANTIEVMVSANTKKYDAETRRLIKEAKNLQKSLELKFDGKQYAEAQRLMKEAISRTDEKAQALRKKLQELKSAGDVKSDSYQKLKAELIKTEGEAVRLKDQLKDINNIPFDNAGKNLKHLTNEAKKLKTVLEQDYNPENLVKAQKKMGQAIEDTDRRAIQLKRKLSELEKAGKVDSNEYRELESELSDLRLESIELKKSLQEINQMKIDNLVNGFKNAGESITKAGQALMPFSAAAASVIAGLGAIGASAVKAGDYIGTTAQQLNISSEALQKWLYIADQTDVEAQQFVNAVTKMQGALAHLAQGESDITATALMELGITAEEASLGMEANFEKIVNSLANVSDATRQAYLANEIFGTRMGSKIIPLLNDGGEGLKALGEQFEQMGYLSEDTVNDLDAFEDTMDRIKYQFGLIKNEIGASFLPLMEAMANTIETKVVPVFQRLRDFFQGLTMDQQKLILGILTFTAAIAPVLLIVGKLTSGVGSMIGMIAKLGTSLSGLGVSLGPIAAIAAVFALLYTTNENFRNSINSLVSTLGSALMPILKVVGNLFETVLKAIMPLVDILGNQLAMQIQFLVTALAPFIQVLTNVLVPVLNVVFSVLQTVLGFILGPLSKGFKLMSDLYIGLFKGIQEFIQKVMDYVSVGVNKAIDFINEIIRNINKIGDKLGFTISEIENVKLQLETGELPVQETSINTDANVPVNQAINNNTNQQINNNNIQTTTDNSTRNITIEPGAIVIQNYSENLDYEEMSEKIVIELAKNY
jgi:ribosomal protein L19E